MMTDQQYDNQLGTIGAHTDNKMTAGCIGGAVCALICGSLIPLWLILANYGGFAALVSIIPSLILGFLIGGIVGTVIALIADINTPAD